MDKTQKNMAEFLARVVVTELVKKKKINLATDDQAVIKIVADIIYEDFHVEEELNEKVRQLLKEHNKELQSSNADYNKLFNMIKKKLIEEEELDI
ncbi:MAG: DUF507 family protein [Candidatus Schekmanbacteria bacterium]|nr:DUF507 family protein [Candidatus Schekmanbacteria bacterium]